MGRDSYPRRADYPRLISVGRSIYHVVFMRRLEHGNLGMCDDQAKLILISLDQDRREMFATFCHELLHAAERELSMELGHGRIRKLEYLFADLFEVFR